MIGGVSPETCWAIKKHWNNKFYYTVASCWFLVGVFQRAPFFFNTCYNTVYQCIVIWLWNYITKKYYSIFQTCLWNSLHFTIVFCSVCSISAFAPFSFRWPRVTGDIIYTQCVPCVLFGPCSDDAYQLAGCVVLLPTFVLLCLRFVSMDGSTFRWISMD
jgi:hypothetical protein